MQMTGWLVAVEFTNEALTILISYRPLQLDYSCTEPAKVEASVCLNLPAPARKISNNNNSQMQQLKS
jgi:hypothetical protein